ncbi:MAG: hypothetical protein K2X27_02935 [Candidatus Obscuribacterales bacterium]|nr:hypothetical protein [Candidatus Obscuribacterales bacterium]
MSKQNFVNLPGGNLKRISGRWNDEGMKGDKTDSYYRRQAVEVLWGVALEEALRSLEEEDNVDSETNPSGTWTVLRANDLSRWIIIEGDKDLAVRVFAARNRGQHPGSTRCTCCGPDFSIWTTSGKLSQATAYARNCDHLHDRWEMDEDEDPQYEMYSNPEPWQYHSLKQFLSRPDVELIRKSDITPSEGRYPMPPRLLEGEVIEEE